MEDNNNQIMEMTNKSLNTIITLNKHERIIEIQLSIMSKLAENIQQLNNNLNETMILFESRSNDILEKIKIEFAIRDLYLLINEYAFETNTISEVLTYATLGKINHSVINNTKLLEEINIRKLTLPKQMIFPIEINENNINTLIKISRVTIIHKNNYLIYIIKLPLVDIRELTLYNINYEYFYIKPQYQFLAINIHKEYYVYTKEQLNECKIINENYLCDPIQTRNLKDSKTNCEVELFFNNEVNVEDCNIKILEFNKNIFHKLHTENKWLYIVQEESIIVTCEPYINTHQMTITGTGLLSLGNSCRAHTKNVILETTKINTTIKTDFIPQIKISNLIQIKNNLKIEKGKNIIKLQDLDINSKTYKELKESDLEETEKDKINFNMSIHHYIIYIVIITLIGILTHKSIKLIKRHINKIPEDIKLEERNTEISRSVGGDNYINYPQIQRDNYPITGNFN
jgi:hypothetical protein